ncbi:MAG TPA: hypothetical protein VKZ63_02425 [Kofleriaceae bacterium]|nr:hypothetical protein [Kofleriaceae bacterium]
MPLPRPTLLPVGALAAAAALAACGGGVEPGGPDSGPTGQGELLLGGADDTGNGFVPLEDGADVPLIGGAQGGFHVWIGLRVRGIEGELRIEREARRVSDGELVLRTPVQELVVPGEAMDGWWERPDAAASFMCPSPIAIQVYDEEIVFRAEITSEDGELLAVDDLVAVPRCPDGDQAEFCQSICGG